MWCSASSRTTSPISFGGTSGIWIFLMMSSRPQIRDRRVGPFTPAFATASFHGVGDGAGIVDGAVGDGVVRQRHHAEAGQGPRAAALAGSDDLHRAGTDVQAEALALFSRRFYLTNFLARWVSSIGFLTVATNVFARPGTGAHGPEGLHGPGLEPHHLWVTSHSSVTALSVVG